MEARGPEPQITVERVPYRATMGAGGYSNLRLPVSILLDNVRSMYNVGAFFRTADGAGIERLLLSGITARPPKNGITKTALGAESRVAWKPVENVKTEIDELRAGGYEIAAIETSMRAVDIFDWQPAFPVCVLFGHEVDGLAPEVSGGAAMDGTGPSLPWLPRPGKIIADALASVFIWPFLSRIRNPKRVG